MSPSTSVTTIIDSVPPGTAVPPETSPETSPDTSPDTGPEGLSAAEALIGTGDDELDRQLVGLMEFVTEARGLPFLSPVAVSMLPDDEFEAVVLAGYDDRASIAAMERRRDLLVAMGLWPPEISYLDAMRVLMREGVVGLYIPSTGALFIRGTELTPLVSQTVVHELTHALDDQWFDLEDPVADDDESFAVAALAEGSTTWVEEQFIEQMSAADRVAAARQAAREIAAMELPEMPLAVTEISESVYSLGHTYVSQLIAAGGQQALNSAFAQPPASTEELLHPGRAGSAIVVQQVAAPQVSGQVVGEGVLGEQGMIEVLNAALAPAVARSTADGWGGDRYVIVEGVGEVCVILDVVADSEDEVREMRLGWTSWATRQSDATVQMGDGDVVRVEACSTVF